MTVMESLRDYFAKSPPLRDKRLNLDCLASKPYSYSIDTEPGETVVKRYCDGSCVRRQPFTISGRTIHGPDIKKQTENIEFFSKLEAWLIQQEMQASLPLLADTPLSESLLLHRTARSLTVLSAPSQVIVDEDAGTSRYQISMQLIYNEEVKRL